MAHVGVAQNQRPPSIIVIAGFLLARFQVFGGLSESSLHVSFLLSFFRGIQEGSEKPATLNPIGTLRKVYFKYFETVWGKHSGFC